MSRTSAPGTPTPATRRTLSPPAALLPLAGAVCALLLPLLAVPAAADDWPGFRGSGQSGSAAAEGLFEGEGPGLARAWRTALGSSYASLAVVDGRVFTLSNDGTSDILVALENRTGSVLWQQALGPLTAGHDGSEDGASSTPTVVGERVFVLAADGVLHAFSVADGELLWRTNVHQIEGLDEPKLEPGHVADIEGGPGIPFYGHVASPLVLGDQVVVPRGESPAAVLASFDIATGTLRWTALPGKAEYQSPIAHPVNGQPGFLFWADSELAALSADGKVQWRCKAGNNSNASPLPVSADTFLLLGDRETALVKSPAANAAADAACETVWTSRKLKGSMSSPVVHEGTIYGFDRNFLSALDLETGDVLWKSRPPGGNGLILVGDRLAIFASDGEVVLAKASREGYEEEARLKVTDRESLTWPAFADGMLFVRDRTHVAAVRITDQPMQTREDTPLVEGTEFTSFVRAAEGSDRPSVWVDHFFRQHTRFPIREGQTVHFVYRGSVEDVGLTGSWLPGGDEVSLVRLPDTDLFYRSVPVPPELRIEYGFRIDFENIGPDPLNPRRVPGLFSGERSELLAEGATDPELLAPFAGEQRGTVETFTLESKARGDEREVTVYLSAHEVAEGAGRALVVVPNGSYWLRAASLVNSLDHLVARGELPPFAVAFVPQDQRLWFLEEDGRLTPAMTELLAAELVPAMRQRYGAGRERDSTILVADDWTGSLALYALFSKAETFGAAAVFSYPYGLTLQDQIVELAGKPAAARSRIFLGWNRYSSGDGEDSSATATKALWERLQETPVQLEGGERFDSEGWGSRRLHVLEAVQSLLVTIPAP